MGLEIQKTSIEVISASDLNPRYVNCIPFFIDFWLLMSEKSDSIFFKPHVYLISNKLPAFLQQYKEYITLIDADNVHTAFQSQVIRLLVPSLSESEFALTTDIDMLPLNDNIFKNLIQNYRPTEEFIIVRDVLQEDEYPICYNLAAPRTWRKIFPIKDLNDVKVNLIRLYGEINTRRGYDGKHGGVGWNFDQTLLFSKIKTSETKGLSVLRFRDSETKHRRLDRAYHFFPLNWLTLPFVYFNVFSDYHVHHPIRHYRFFIFLLRFTLINQTKH